MNQWHPPEDSVEHGDPDLYRNEASAAGEDGAAVRDAEQDGAGCLYGCTDGWLPDQPVSGEPARCPAGCVSREDTQRIAELARTWPDVIDGAIAAVRQAGDTLDELLNLGDAELFETAGAAEARSKFTEAGRALRAARDIALARQRTQREADKDQEIARLYARIAELEAALDPASVPFGTGSGDD